MHSLIPYRNAGKAINQRLYFLVPCRRAVYDCVKKLISSVHPKTQTTSLESHTTISAIKSASALTTSISGQGFSSSTSDLTTANPASVTTPTSTTAHPLVPSSSLGQTFTTSLPAETFEMNMKMNTKTNRNTKVRISMKHTQSSLSLIGIRV